MHYAEEQLCFEKMLIEIVRTNLGCTNEKGRAGSEKPALQK
jgi:hypothetical protein